MNTKLCPICNKLLPIPSFGKHRKKSTNGKYYMFTRGYCKTCRSADEYRRKIKNNHYTVSRNGSSYRALVCIECGRTYLSDSMLTKYCSSICSSNNRRSFVPRKKPSRKIVGMVCVICGNSYKGATNTRYCSNECKLEKARIKQREYRKRVGYNTDSDRARSKRRRARERGAEGSFTTKELLLLEKIQSTCQHPGCNKTCCDNGDNLHLHHIVPLSEGGTNYIDNLQRLCAKHHIERHS